MPMIVPQFAFWTRKMASERGTTTQGVGRVQKVRFPDSGRAELGWLGTFLTKLVRRPVRRRQKRQCRTGFEGLGGFGSAAVRKAVMAAPDRL